jgi:phage terminase large subunit GpA-like protein
VSTTDPVELVDRILREHLRMKAPLTVDAWADRYRVLSRETAAEPGRWRTDRTPYMRQILRDLSDSSSVAEVVCQFGTQLGKTEAGNSWLGYIIDHAPGPVLIVQPTVDLGKRYSQQRIAPLVNATPRLADKVMPARSRDSGNKILTKAFPGGLLVITGANSAAGLASMPARYVFLDEVDDYPLDVDGQGAPVAIATARQDTFTRRKTLITSSPKRPTGLSLIESRFNSGTRFRYFVPCPHCSHSQVLEWAGTEDRPGLRYRDDDPSSVAYVCAGCGAEIEEHHKTAMLAAGKWIADVPDARVHSYHLSSLYSPLGWVSWRKIVEEYLTAQQESKRGDPQPYKTWVNTRLAMTYREEAARVEESHLRARASVRSLRTVPEACLVLTAGVDVQDNRLEVLVYAWGPGEECAIVDMRQIWGDPTQTTRLPGGQPTVWERLDALFEERYRHAGGRTLAVEAAAVDTGGHCTHAVYAYCRQRHATRVHAGGQAWVRRTYAIKGMDRPGLPVKGRASPVDINWRGGIVKNGVQLWIVGVTAAKDWWYAHLRVPDPGPGHVHLAADLPDEWYAQMTSERRTLARTARGERYVWALESGKRNEAWDCSVYALFAAHALDLNRFTAAMWERLRERVAPVQYGLLDPDPVEQPTEQLAYEAPDHPSVAPEAAQGLPGAVAPERDEPQPSERPASATAEPPAQPPAQLPSRQRPPPSLAPVQRPRWRILSSGLRSPGVNVD